MGVAGSEIGAGALGPVLLLPPQLKPESANPTDTILRPSCAGLYLDNNSPTQTCVKLVSKISNWN